ncbi:MAG: dihydrodipicolinate synthase family protein [Bacteroidetes bacterium]|nr:dihydrodipicolinate synthase family protein [Bacteroidota bacterium]
MNKFEGLIAAPFTPMFPNGDVNFDMVEPYYAFLERNGIVGAFINGSTGEGVSLSQKERMKHTERWAACYKERKTVRVINLVGGTSYTECIENALFSVEMGVSAIALLAPFYFKPDSATQLAEFVARVGEAVPDIPVYFYHIPVLTGVNIPMIDFLKEVALMLPNFAGIKYTHEDFMDFLSCMNYDNGKYEMLWGRDETMLSALVLGAKGAVGSTFNYAAPIYYRMIDAYNNGDIIEARKLQQQSINMIRLLGKYGGIATGKAFMKFVGVDCGQFRLPVKNMSNDQYSLFVQDVQSLNMNHLFSK